jgi:tetratricopeptide (TPR) repeat protein
MKIVIAFLLLVTFCYGCANSQSTQLKRKADTYYYQSNYDSALFLFSQLIKMDSSNGEYFFKRGVCYMKFLRNEKSINDFIKSADLNYRQSSCFYNIGLDYAAENDSLALLYFNKCILIDPTHSKCKQAIEETKVRLKFDASLDSSRRELKELQGSNYKDSDLFKSRMKKN